MTGRRGRPRGPETIPVTALLTPEQKAKLDYLSAHLTGRPKVAGLLRQAVDEFLERYFTDEYAADFNRTWRAETGANDVPDEPLRLIR